MTKHWQHTEYVEPEIYKQFAHHNVPIIPSINLPYNTAVYIEAIGGGKRLEGVYDPAVKGIRQLRCKDAPNRDLRLYMDTVKNENVTVLAVDGLMGTGKTSTLIHHLIKTHLGNVRSWKTLDGLAHSDHKLANGEHKILIAKPAVNASGEEYGFLPGDINQKIEPTIKNYTQYFDRWHEAGFEVLRESGYVEILPLGFIRGLDAENISVVVDECQNTKELVTVATRRAEGSRIFLLGDTSPFQIDLKGNTPQKNGLADIIDLLAGAPYFQYIEMKSLEHIVRSDEVRDIVRRLFKKYGEDPKHWIV